MKKTIIYILVVLMLAGIVAAVSVTTPTITPANPATADNLVCSGTVTDDNMLVNMTVFAEWRKENVVQAARAANTTLVNNNTVQNFTLSAAYTTKWENWSCRLNATNMTEASAWTAGATNRSINDTCPTSTATVSPTVIYSSTETVTGACGYADADSDTEGTSTYKWFISGIELNADTDTSLSNKNFTAADTIEFECVPVNADCSAARSRLNSRADNSTLITVKATSGAGGSGGSSHVSPKKVTPVIPAKQAEQSAEKNNWGQFKKVLMNAGESVQNIFAKFFALFKRR